MQNNDAKSSAKSTSLQWTADLVQNFWNYQSQFPEKYFTNLYGDRIADAVRIFVPRRARILDYACGTGALTAHLLRAGFSVGACDLSPDSVEYVQKTHAGHPAFLGASTIDSLVAGTERFDAVVLVELFEHLDAPALTRVMADLHKVLVPDGRIIVTTPNDEDLDIETVYCPCCNYTFHRWQHMRSWNKKNLPTYLALHGFETTTMNEVDFSTSLKDGFIRYYLKHMFRTLYRRKLPHLMVVAKIAPEIRT